MYRLCRLVNIFVRATNLKNIISKKFEEGGAGFTIVLNYLAFITRSLKKIKMALCGDHVLPSVT